MRGVPVRGVLAERKLVGSDVGIDIAATDGEKWTEEGEAVVEVGDGRHAGKAVGAGTSAKIGENGFGLVVEVMGEEDELGAVLLGGAEEKGVALVAGGGFDGLAVGFGERGDFGPFDLEREMVSLGEAADEGRVLAGVASSQAMVEVAEDEVLVSCVEEEMKECHGVSSAGDGEEGLPAGEGGEESGGQRCCGN